MLFYDIKETLSSSGHIDLSLFNCSSGQSFAKSSIAKNGRKPTARME